MRNTRLKANKPHPARWSGRPPLRVTSQHAAATAPAPPPTRARTLRQVGLLACGIVASLVYLASDVIAGMRREGYSQEARFAANY